MKKLIINLLSKAGYQVINKSKINFSVSDYKYELITTNANYAPWLLDEEFKKTYAAIKNNTLVDIYRCYELWQLAEDIHHLDNTAGFIEVGVWKGGTAGILGKKLSLLNSKATLYLADTFTGIVKATDKDMFYNGGEHADTSIETVEALMTTTYDHYKILTGIFPNDTANLIPAEEKFGLCHIDVDVYQSGKDIVDWIWGRMIIGGVIVFDDYGFHTTTGITTYVNEQKNKKDRSVIYNLNGHALMIKLK
mgnify:CR=1 FL=1